MIYALVFFAGVCFGVLLIAVVSGGRHEDR